jgi:beta-barrel assembly-enhancing protease
MRALKITGLCLSAVLIGCGTNPVTGKKEIQFVSEAQELRIGAENYAPMRQSEGGDFKIDPELTTYVNEVGQKLAAVSDRKLPYEFVVLNSSVPNAWSLPGGKIAVNRGLLTELKNESELAAVLGHEITQQRATAPRHRSVARCCRSAWSPRRSAWLPAIPTATWPTWRCKARAWARSWCR